MYQTRARPFLAASLLAALTSAIYVDGWDPGFVGVAVALCAVSAAILVSRPVTEFRVTAMDIIVGAFTAWVVAVTLARDLPWVADYQLTLFALLPLGYLVARADPEFTWKWVPGCIVLLASAVALASLTLVAVGQPPNVHFPVWNNQAAFLSMALLLLVAAMPGNRPSFAGTRWALAVLLAAAIAVIGSRGAFIALGLAMLSMLIICAPTSRRRLLGHFVAILVGALLGELLTHGFVIDRAAALVDGAGSRFGMWFSAIPLVFDRPIAGHGLGMTELVWAPHRLLDDRTLGLYLHNDYLQFALETGIPAALMLMLVPLLALRAARLTASTTGLRAPAALGATIYLSIHCLVDYHLQVPSLALTWGLVLGALAVAEPALFVVHRPWQRAHRWAVVLAVPFVVHAVLLVVYQQSMPVADTRYARITDSAMASIMHYREPADPDVLHARLQGTERAAAVQPHADDPLVFKAGILRQLGRPAAAESALAKVIDRNRFAHQGYYQRAMLRLERGEREAAMVDLRDAVTIRPRFFEAHALMFDMLMEEGRDEEAYLRLRTAFAQRVWVPQELHGFILTANRMATDRHDHELMETTDRLYSGTVVP